MRTFDQFEQNLAGIFQSVGGADRDTDRFVLMNDFDQFVCWYPRGASHTPAVVDRSIEVPGTLNPKMILGDLRRDRPYYFDAA